MRASSLLGALLPALLVGSISQAEPWKTYEVFFSPGSAKLSSKAQRDIHQAAREFNEKGVRVVSLMAATDTTGSVARNARVAGQRADAVAQALWEAGYQWHVYSAGCGETTDASPSRDGVNDARSRRVVFAAADGDPDRVNCTPRARQ